MKTQQITLLLILTMVVIMAVGCAQTANQTTAPLTKLTTLPATSFTPTETPLPTFTPTPEATSTLSPIPGLPEEQAHAKLLKLIANNGECHLPCLWGITPGKSTFEEARAILMPISSLAYATYLDSSTSGNVDLHYVEDDLTHYWNVGFTSPGSGIVNHIRVLAAVWKEFPDGNMYNFDSAAFGKRTTYYSLGHVLSEQGMPASVIMQTLGNQIVGKDVESFHVLLVYPNQGLFIRYSTYSQLVGANLRGCLANAHIEMELYPAGDADGFSKALSQTDWAFTWPKFASNLYWKSIEEATSMTLEQFYETFRQPTDMCIETPATLWPAP